MHPDLWVRAGLRPPATARSALLIFTRSFSGVVMVLRITRGYSPEYLLKEVATGRENYYTGAVAAGEPPGRWWGAGAEALGLTGLVDPQDMRAVYERFLDPRAEGFNDPSRWDEVSTLGHTGRKYLSEDELYAAALEREPDATPERRAELRVQAGQNARHNVAFFDITFNVQKSVTLAAHRVRGAGGRRPPGRGRRDRRGVGGVPRRPSRTPSGRATTPGWPTSRRRPATPASGTTAAPRAAGSTRTTGSWRRSSSTTPATTTRTCTSTTAMLNRVQGPDGVWRTLDGRSLFRWRPAAAAVAERMTAERLTHALGVLLATRPDGKAREIVGVAQEAMDLISTRRSEAHREGRGARRGVRGPQRAAPRTGWSASG